MDAANLARLNDARRARRAAMLLTDLEKGGDTVVLEGEPVEPSLRADIEAAFRSGKSTAIEVDGHRYFLNVHLPPAHIVIIGAVHISQVLAQMASLAGFDVRIIDPRTAFATPERFLGIDLTADWPVDVFKDRPLDAYTALVAVTHDPKIDDFALKAALDANCFYVGALGSRKTHAKRVERLLALGASADQIARIHAPIGLDIDAVSPAEIAVAIMGQITQVLRQKAEAP